MIVVYSIYNDETCLYVGVTNNYERRVHEHSKALESGIHNNKSLQKYVNEVGYHNIDFKVAATYDTDCSLIKYFCRGIVE